MGNYRFKLSDMIPNAWFYKLRYMSRTRNQNHSHFTNKNPKKSSYQSPESLYNSPNNSKASDTHFPRIDPPRKSSRTKRKTICKPSPKQINPSVSSAEFVFQDFVNPVWLKPQTVQVLHSSESNVSSEVGYSTVFDNPAGSCSSSCSCKLRSSAADIVLDLENTSYRAKKVDSVSKFDLVLSEPDLPPILTDPMKQYITEKSQKRNLSSAKFQESHSTQITKKVPQKSTSTTRRVKLKGIWARFSTKRRGSRRRKSMKISGKKELFLYSQRFAMVKASFDPERDFKDSMMEMIVENNINESTEFEQLLACYLSLNSSQYHDVILRAFEQTWFNMSQMKYLGDEMQFDV